MQLLPTYAALMALAIIISILNALYAYRCHAYAFQAQARHKDAERLIESQRETIKTLQRDLRLAQKSMGEMAHELNCLKLP